MANSSPFKGYELWVTSANQLNFYLINTFGSNYISVNTNDTMSLNTWNFVTVTYDGSSSAGGVKMYINGKLSTNNISANSLSATIAGTDTPYIGSRANAAWYFTGSVDSVRVYNYARSAAQVAWEYNRGGPYAWWKFDECQGTTLNDSSGNGNTGTWSGSTGSQTSVGTCSTSSTAWGNGATGKINSSLNFDGTDDKVSTTDLDPFDDFSAAAWIKTSASGAIQRIMDKDGGAGNDYWTVYVTLGGTIEADLRNGAGSTTNVITSKTFNDGNWHHVVFVRSGSNLTIYVDGMVAASGTKTTFTFNNANAFAIGNAAVSVSGQYFTGKIDDVRVYRYGLTQKQVLDIYNLGAASFRPATGTP
jgi:hypothetical protein